MIIWLLAHCVLPFAFVRHYSCHFFPSPTHKCKVQDRRKSEAILGMRHQMLWFFCSLGGWGGQCVSPGCLSGLTYSKADCSLSGCLYTISIIMGGERPLLHASQHDDTSPPASLLVESFFFFILLAHLVFPQVFLIQTISLLSLTLCVF